jgi:hypothetical protein
MRSQLLRVTTTRSQTHGSHKNARSDKKPQPALFPIRFWHLQTLTDARRQYNPALKDKAASAKAEGVRNPGDLRANPLLRLELELCRPGTCQLGFCRLDTCRLASCRLALLQQPAVREVGPQRRPRPRRQVSQLQRSEISTSESPCLLEDSSS